MARNMIGSRHAAVAAASGWSTTMHGFRLTGINDSNFFFPPRTK
uniref:Uncharacterized protein n=1 Tax=Setaria italica TaxID=4555 RepID=K3ZPE4_SETIT